MDVNYTKHKPIIGIDERLNPDQYTASNITMFRQDENGGWINDVGWEPLIPEDTPISVLTPQIRAELAAPIRFLSIWPRQESAEVYYLFERAGTLTYQWGNKGLGSSQTIDLGYATTDSQIYSLVRSDTKPDDPGTQLANYGRFAVLLNGKDEMIKFWGRQRVEPFGFLNRPSSPTVLQPQPSAYKGGTDLIRSQSSYIHFASNDYWGVGEGANGSLNTYVYRLAYISDTGSISPMSLPVQVGWSITNANEIGKQGIVLSNLPRGPLGTIGRILYRSKNQRGGLTGENIQVYELVRIMENASTTYIDFYPDSQLDAVPADLLASEPIDSGYKYGTEWDGCLWLAGGASHPNRIIYSKQGAPEQFPTLNIFEISASFGGHITGLCSYYNALLVFRESAIHIITKQSGQYSLSVLDASIGTTATNTIKLVPEKGIFFLNQAGVFAISGGLYGGSQYKLQNISLVLEEEWKRLSNGALPRATATYSHREKEYWVHYPCDGGTENSRGAVFHSQTNGWSLRNTEGSVYGEMVFTQLATDPDGWIIMAPLSTIPDTVSWWEDYTAWPGIGLQVWSRANNWGSLYTYVSAVEEDVTYDITPRPVGNSKFISVWEDLNAYDEKKSVQQVITKSLSQGNNTVPLTWYVDYGYTGTSTQNIASQQADYYNSDDAQWCLTPTTEKRSAVWNASEYENSKQISMRWDCGTRETSSFKWEIITDNYFHISSYQLALTSKGQRSPRQH